MPIFLVEFRCGLRRWWLEEVEVMAASKFYVRISTAKPCGQLHVGLRRVRHDTFNTIANHCNLAEGLPSTVKTS